MAERWETGKTKEKWPRGAVIQAVMAQLGSNGVKMKNHGTDKMECFPKDKELLKGKGHTYNRKILGKNKGKEASK